MKLDKIFNISESDFHYDKKLKILRFASKDELLLRVLMSHHHGTIYHNAFNLEWRLTGNDAKKFYEDYLK